MSRTLLDLRQFGQQVVVAFDGAQTGQREIKRRFLAGSVALALLERDDRPADRRHRFPIAHACIIDRLTGAFFIAGIESRAGADAAGLALDRAEAPAAGAEPAEILVGIAPAGKLEIEDRGEL